MITSFAETMITLDITKTESNNSFVLLCIELNKMNVVFSFFTDRKQH